MDYRIYHFSTFYLSSIQQGIQAAHAQTEMALNCFRHGKIYNEEARNIYIDWATNHKTMICLNAGDLATLKNIKQTFQKQDQYPHSSFSEGEDALGGILTNVAIVLPDRVYDFLCNALKNTKTHTIQEVKLPNQSKQIIVQQVAVIPHVYDMVGNIERTEVFTEKDIEIATILNSCGLAR